MCDIKLGVLARAGFSDLTWARETLLQVAAASGTEAQTLITCFSAAADPDQALRYAVEFITLKSDFFSQFNTLNLRRFALIAGVSAGLMDFYLRHDAALTALLQEGGKVVSRKSYLAQILAVFSQSAKGAANNTSAVLVSDNTGTYLVPPGEAGWQLLRTKYRELLGALVLWELEQVADTETALQNAAEIVSPVTEQTVLGDILETPSQTSLDTTQLPATEIVFKTVAQALSNLADAALTAALLCARATLAAGHSSGVPVQAAHALAAPLAIITMGKCGAGELNMVSDVDVLFITDNKAMPAQLQAELSGDTLLRVATRLASEVMRAIHAPALEPALWEVDANLRPEGKNGALVRTLSSYLSYYERWAETWEFQALLKARAAAGDIALGQEFIAAITPAVWESRKRPDFVGNVQRMRERVTEHIDVADLDYQLKLGPGGLRDIEFSVQLLQLVHGAHDLTLRDSATIPALRALAAGGYIARTDCDELAAAYVALRTLEHRLQLRQLRRTALMPRDEEETRVLARAAGYTSASELLGAWERLKRRVRALHLKIFYAPLLSAVAKLPLSELTLTNEAAAERLKSIGFRDPAGALRHLRALTAGSGRTAQIQRNLLPVFLQWLGEGADPDGGLIAFRRISEANAKNPWYLRLLRDGAEAAERLMRVLSGSRYAAELLEQLPEAVAWLEENRKLEPASFKHLLGEMSVVAARKPDLQTAAAALRSIHKREMLRLALGQLSGVCSDKQVSLGLDAAHTALLQILLAEIEKREPSAKGLRFALIAMGRYGGKELGFASDIDLLAVYQADNNRAHAQQDAIKTVTLLRALAADPFAGVDIDFDLRPEGKNGALVRNLEGYRAYYEKWSLAWEAQALLRARFIGGSAELGAAFIELADSVRYPEQFSAASLREVMVLKARMETERLPRGVQPHRHLKLGPGGVSDTEWIVQLLQLQHAKKTPQLRTQSTLSALDIAVDTGLMHPADANVLAASWILASRLRSATMLWSGRSADSLPTDRRDLDGIGRILGYKPDTTTELEEEWLAASRKSRRVFERLFFGA